LDSLRPNLSGLLKEIVKQTHMWVRGIFNPFIYKHHLLVTHAYFTIKKGRGVSDLLISKVFGEIGKFFHKGCSKRLKEKGYRIPKDKEKIINFLATSFRMVDDILDEHPVRYQSQTGLVVQSPWTKLGILKTTPYALALSIKAKEVWRRELPGFQYF